jgi:hypothetical protein
MGDLLLCLVFFVGGLGIGIGLTSRDITKPAITSAIAQCEPNAGLVGLTTSGTGVTVTAKCGNGASFEIDNRYVQQKEKS